MAEKREKLHKKNDRFIEFSTSYLHVISARCTPFDAACWDEAERVWNVCLVSKLSTWLTNNRRKNGLNRAKCLAFSQCLEFPGCLAAFNAFMFDIKFKLRVSAFQRYPNCGRVVGSHEIMWVLLSQNRNILVNSYHGPNDDFSHIFNF